MRVTVRISDVEVTIERENFDDYTATIPGHRSDVRQNMMKDTVLPTLQAAIDKAKDLYNLKQI